MLAPEDRAVLGEQLRPDLGMVLDAAVATTFTLDLTAALVAPLAFASFEANTKEDSLALLEAVRQSADRVDIFCQAGQMRVPAKASDLMAMLEPMVHAVTAPVPGYLFHPKVWVLRYRHSEHPDEQPSFRLLCGSRNLTNDVSWDAFIRVDGHQMGRRPIAANNPLVELIELLPRQTVGTLPKPRRERILGLAQDLRTVDWELPDGATAMHLHALGLRPRQRRSRLLEALDGRENLVVSPFLDDEALERLTPSSGASTVVSRAEALERLSPSTLVGKEFRIVNPLAGLHDLDQSAEHNTDDAPGNGGLLGDLHAKVYVVERGQQARLFIGSANATTAGLTNKNVEFMVELVAGRKTFGLNRFLGVDGFAKMLLPYEPTGMGRPRDDNP